MNGFPDVLLPEVLDYLDLHELLSLAMLVSRFWRLSAIEHPQYWKSITLDQESTHERRVESVDLFLLRLARAGGRPVDLRIWMRNPAAVLDTLARELYHIRSLTMCVEITHGQSIFHSMRDAPALILEDLNLSFQNYLGLDSPEPISIPPRLFALEAPVLTQVGFTNSALPSDGELPSWLSNVTSFIYHIATGPVVSQLPNVFAPWPRLRDLRLSGMIGLDDPVFLQASTWAPLEFLSLEGGLSWHLNTLPLSHIPCIRITNIFHFSADHLVLIANSLANPEGLLDVTLMAQSSDNSATLNLILKCLSDAGKWRGRWTEGFLPRDAPGSHPDDFVTALQHPPLLERIASLCVSLHSWDILVGRGFLSQFPEVESLVLTLELWYFDWHEAWHAPSRTATLALPRLRRITFRFEHYGPAYRTPVLQLTDLAEFATQQLSCARLPLRLSLEGVESRGAPEEFADVFQI